MLEELRSAAAAIADEEARGRALLQVATSLAKAGETDRARKVVDALPTCGHRALGVARVAFALEHEGLGPDAAAMFERALVEVREA